MFVQELARVKAKAKQQSSDIVKLNRRLEELQHEASSPSVMLSVEPQDVVQLQQPANT